ncbi:single-stranded DNA-binding protein [Candidimonas sp. SYP-B2681]|uniref:single-stranded DNA-binding protein n=1 Tax=Candidimonas sp. SYP-B2681 TaxID=2497686 RepID=UPI000F891FCE|nr:single-stranded DNA-binding protein [Candidimonas sp. SYP-B2681]RTZ47846.1 single-stranded DNA-binding protein [Candidimonas sp. SYP-B2681]
MIDALTAGRLYGAAKQGTGKTGETYTTAKVKVAAGNGDTLLCNVIAFDEKVQEQLLALDDGDSVAMSGSLTPKVYQDKTGDTRPTIDLVCHAVMTPYHVQRKRQAMLGQE